jgi:intein-encoded DNA endonuclease-like protein
MYDDTIKLRKQGLTHGQIQERIYEKYGMQLPQPTISNWVNEKHKPFRNLNKFDGKPSPELSYIIGAILGDGTKYMESGHRNYTLELKVKDKDFAETFGHYLAKVLHREKPYGPHLLTNGK